MRPIVVGTVAFVAATPLYALFFVRAMDRLVAAAIGLSIAPALTSAAAIARAKAREARPDL